MLFKSKSHVGVEMERAARDYVDGMGKDASKVLKKISDNFPYLEDIAMKIGDAYDLSTRFLKETDGMEIPGSYTESISKMNPTFEDFQSVLSDELFVLRHLDVDKDQYIESLENIHGVYDIDGVKGVLSNYNQFFDEPGRISWLNNSIADLNGHSNTEELVDLLTQSLKNNVDTDSLKDLLSSIDGDDKLSVVSRQLSLVNTKKSLLEPVDGGFKIEYDDYASHEKAYGIFVPFIDYISTKYDSRKSGFDDAKLNHVGRLTDATYKVDGSKKIETTLKDNSVVVKGLKKEEIEAAFEGLQDLEAYYGSYTRGLRSIYAATNWFSPSGSKFSYGNISYEMDWEEASKGAKKINVVFDGRVKKSLWDSLESLKGDNNGILSKGLRTTLGNRRLDVTVDTDASYSLLKDVGSLAKKYSVVESDDVDSLCFINSSLNREALDLVDYTDFDFAGFSNSYRRGTRAFENYFEFANEKSKEQSVKIMLNMKREKENKEISKWLVENHKDFVNKISRS